MHWRDRFAAARVRVVSRQPYYVHAIMRLRPIEVPGMGTMGVDAKWRIGVDPAAVERWGSEKTAAVLAHEIEHPLRGHHERLGNRNPVRANIAGDLAINPNVVGAGWELPEGALMPAMYSFKDGLLMEEYYEMLPESNGGFPKPGMGEGVDGNPPAPGNGNCGSCAGKKQAWEGMVPEDDKPEGANEAEIEIIRRQTAEAIRECVQRKPGSVPGGLANWAEAFLAPSKIPWQAQLRTLARNALASFSGADLRTWRRLSGRYFARRSLYGNSVPPMPAYYSPKPKMVVVLDVSGSMQGENEQGRLRMDAALTEVVAIQKVYGCPLEVLAVDTQVQTRAQVKTLAQVHSLTERGFGGTHMPTGIEAGLLLKPDVLIVITDGETAWPAPGDIPSTVRLIACIVTKAEAPAWMRVVRVED